MNKKYYNGNYKNKWKEKSDKKVKQYMRWVKKSNNSYREKQYRRDGTKLKRKEIEKERMKRKTKQNT